MKSENNQKMFSVAAFLFIAFILLIFLGFKVKEKCQEDILSVPARKENNNYDQTRLGN